MIVEVRDLEKVYQMGEVSVPALRGVSFDIDGGDFIAIMGPSGSGKSTLMNIVGLLDKPTRGSAKIEGIKTSQMDDDQASQVRNKKIGFVFQSFNLLSNRSALKNVELPLMYSNIPREARAWMAKKALELVGLADRIYHRPTELSIGEQQRVATARALVNNPSIILADEPTGNLDSKSGEGIMNIFQKLNQEGVTILLISHDRHIAQYSKKILHLIDGLIVKVEPLA